MAMVLAGPTAVGKTHLVLELAKHLSLAVISIDSRQIYRGMDIATAKPSLDERARVPHYGIDARDLDQPWTPAEAARDAHEWAQDAWKSGRLPLVTGGSGLYLQAALVGFDSDRRPSDPKLRNHIEARLRRDGLESLVSELHQIDPQSASRVDLANPRRVVRALELLACGATVGGALEARPLLLRGPRFLLVRERADLVHRIDRRVEEFFSLGLVEETRSLLDRWGEAVLERLPTLGYDQVRSYLRGELTLTETIEAVKIATRRYAKRQMTWFRKFGDFDVVDAGAEERALELLLERAPRGA
jgi:tRNA dimethylallyltransferase